MGGDCDGFNIGPGGQPCTAIAVSSVVLDIRNAQNQVVQTATVSFSVDDGEIYSGTCNGNCGAFVLAFEEVGTFDINVKSLGLVPKDITVEVELDEAGCHPVTELVDISLAADNTVAALWGVWRVTSSVYGDAILRFGEGGEIIGAILIDRTIAGDGNFYVQYNGKKIKGAAGQPIQSEIAPEPTRFGNFFNWSTTSLGSPVGFSNATMTSDFQNLSGMLQGTSVAYRRLSLNEIPASILDP